MQLTFLGTGNAQEIPVFGCDCPICTKAQAINTFRRKPASLLITHNHKNIFIDAGLHNLNERFGPTDITAFVLTHYHMDHVQGLFPLRWGIGDKIPVYGPDDKYGCDDLYKHPGILSFQSPLIAFNSYHIGGLELIPVPLFHSKPTLGYIIKSVSSYQAVAYLTDTSGLPDETLSFLKQQSLHAMIIDCNDPPRDTAGRNHNNLNQVIELSETISPEYTYLTHLSHEFDNWMLNHALPTDMIATYDGMKLNI